MQIRIVYLILFYTPYSIDTIICVNLHCYVNYFLTCTPSVYYSIGYFWWFEFGVKVSNCACKLIPRSKSHSCNSGDYKLIGESKSNPFVFYVHNFCCSDIYFLEIFKCTLLKGLWEGPHYWVTLKVYFQLFCQNHLESIISPLNFLMPKNNFQFLWVILLSSPSNSQ